MYEYTNYSLEYITDRLNDAITVLPSVEDVDTFRPKLKQILDTPLLHGYWVSLETMKGVEIPTGTLVLDVETSDNTQTLALASCYHLELKKWYVWVAPEGVHHLLLDVPADCYVIAHRAAFENSFIRNNYTPSRPNYRSFCTFAYAAARLHPLKPSLMRAMPYLPIFKESNVCSLADLYEAATFKELDKSSVEIFIESKGDDWRHKASQVAMDNGIYEKYQAGKGVPREYPDDLKKFKQYDYPTVPRKKVDREALHQQLMDEVLTHENKLILHKLERVMKIENPFTYEAQPYTREEYRAKLVDLLDNSSIDRPLEGFTYNLKDVAATCHIAKYVLENTLPDINEHDFGGIQLCLQPVYALDPEYQKQVEKIEEVYEAEKAKLHRVAELNIKSHALIGGSWDGQDWDTNTKGVLNWYKEDKIGYTKTLNAIASRIHYKGLPLKRVKGAKPIADTVNGGWMFPLSYGDDVSVRSYWAYERNPRPDLSYEERLSLMNYTNSVPLENPENTDPKEFKSVANFFSKTLLKYWSNGEFTCEEPEVQRLIPKFIATSYWTSIRKRILGLKLVDVKGVKYVCPRPSVNGAVSGRNIDPVFLVLAKYDEAKIGSELAGMMVAPPGYKLVAWDLDSCQARMAAILSDAWYARRMGWKKVKIGATEISRIILYGSKKDRTSLAHVLGDTYLGFDLTDPIQADKSYSLGKNAQFSLIFGVGAAKLAKMLGVPYETALGLVTGWKGNKNPHNPQWFIDGKASDLINGQSALSNRMYPSYGDASVWTTQEDVLGMVLQTKMPHVLNPVNSGKEYITTKFNACIQNADVAMLRYTVHEVDMKTSHLNMRYNNSVHDYYSWIVREDHVDEFITIANKIHRSCYEQFLDRWNVDFDTVPEEIWYPSSIDVTQRLLKKPEDGLADKSKTVSFKTGYAQDIWGDESIDESELEELDDDD